MAGDASDLEAELPWWFAVEEARRSGVAALARLDQLRGLNLSQTRVTDAALVHVKRWPRLEELNVRGTGMSQSALDALEQSRPNLKIIR